VQDVGLTIILTALSFLNLSAWTHLLTGYVGTR
jgi:hypothetical protein